MEYFLTVFDKQGKTLLNEVIEADNDDTAIEEGTKRLKESNYLNTTHRLTRSGKLLLFHR